MILTVGLVKELWFISKTQKIPVKAAFSSIDQKYEFVIEIKNDTLYVFYYDKLIWSESLDGADSNFGIESCQEIANITTRIDGDCGWQDFCFFDA